MNVSSSSSSARDHTVRRKAGDKRPEYRIGDVTRLTGLSADTLRYYEKIGLLPSIARTASGIRIYTDKDISRLRFIQRAQKMNFSLAEISSLLTMREDPQCARNNVRELTSMKLEEIKAHLKDIKNLRNELQLLLNLCRTSDAGCPIIESLDRHENR